MVLAADFCNLHYYVAVKHGIGHKSPCTSDVEKYRYYQYLHNIISMNIKIDIFDSILFLTWNVFKIATYGTRLENRSVTKKPSRKMQWK